MYWSDIFAKQIIASGKYKPYWVDDMKTPSGRIHVGSLRGVVVHQLIYQSLKRAGKEAKYSYVFNDMDPMDGFPNYLPADFKKQMGKPLFQIPSPEKGYASLARCYGEQFIEVIKQMGIKPIIIWSSEYYKQGKFNAVIKEALDKVEIVRKLYKEVSGYDKPSNWYPFQVICPKCGKVGTTLVDNWDGQKVSFECKKDLVSWAQGCGYKAKISPFNGTGKLMWKVDWAAHWKVIGITIEGAGKDHMSKGGSHDLASAICRQVFNYPLPFSFLYEWFLAKGGGKMSSSKGIGVSAAEISKNLPADILRFLMVKTNYRQAIIFDPNDNQAILNLFDDYDHYASIYYQKGNKDVFGRVWQLSQVKKPPRVEPFLPRFRDVGNYIQSPSIDIYKKFEQIKGKPLTAFEKNILKERIKYGKIWIEKYAPKELVYQMTKNICSEAKKLSAEQKQYLLQVIKLISGRDWQPEQLQLQLYKLTKKQNLPVAKAFQAIYLSLIGKTHGPKAAWFLLSQDKKLVIKRLKEVSGDK